MNKFKSIFSIMTFLFLLMFVNIILDDWYSFKNKYISIDISSSKSGTAQLFYDIGQGINEEDSNKQLISAREEFETIKFRIPRKENINFIRLDPIDKEAKISIKNIYLQRGNGSIIATYPVTKLVNYKNIETFIIKQNIINLIVKKDSNDPILHLQDINIPFEENRINNFLIERLPSLVLYFFIFMISFFYVLRSLLFSEKVKRTIFLSIDNLYLNSKIFPITAILFTSLLAIIINMYPLFFDRSMNYAAGLPMLYDTLGWMPGYNFNGFFENFRGADVAAHQWIFSPMSMIVHQSVFTYNEFPFWNRFVAGGVPLYGQGYSMLGDPVQWITVIFNGSSVAWDTKFAISKLIFSLGCGLLGFKISKRIEIGLLIAFMAPFIGFYTHVFNHPNYFSLTYLPLGILQWIRFTEIINSQHKTNINLFFNFILTAVVMWLIINSSQTKEGVIAFAFIFGWGILHLLLSIYQNYEKKDVFLTVLICIAAITFFVSPYIIIFLGSLFESATSYDGIVPTDPYPTSLILGFFEPLVFQEWTNNHPLKMQKLVGLSSNILFLFLLLYVSINKIKYNMTLITSIIFFFIAFSIAYGLMPDIVINSIPLVNRIGHNGITFGIPLIMFTIILSIYGAMNINKNNFTRYCFKFWMIVILLLILTTTHFYIDNQVLHTVSFLLFFSIGFYIIQKYIKNKNLIKNNTLEIFTIAFLLVMTLKNGMHLEYGKKLDNFLLNPNVRMDTHVTSQAIDKIKQRNTINGPERVIGEGLNFIPGTNIYFGIESIGSAEALKNPYLENYYKVFGIEKVPGWDWMRLFEPNKINNAQNIAYDSLNVGYFISSVGKISKKQHKLIYSSEVDVFKRPSVWPRAYFTNKVIKVDSEEQYLEKIIQENKPSAIVFNDTYKKINIKSESKEEDILVKATDYRLTPNTTCFTVEAPSKGVIVLLEGFDRDDYILTVNSERKNYFRVNYWSKGFVTNKIGSNDVCYEYRPHTLNLIKYTFLIAIMFITFGTFYIRKRKFKGVH